MTANTKRKSEILQRFAVQWGHLYDLALKAQEKIAIISNEQEERFKRTRAKLLPIYTEMKNVLGREVDPSRNVTNVLSRVSSLKQILEMPEADKSILFHRFEAVQSSIREYGVNISPGSIGGKQITSGTSGPTAAVEEGPSYSISDEEMRESHRRAVPSTFGAVWSRVMMDPVDFFSYRLEKQGINKPVDFILRLFLLIGLIMFLCSLFIFSNMIIATSLERLLEDLSGRISEVVLYVAVWVAVYLVLTTVVLFLLLISSAWSYICMKIVGGEAPYGQNYSIHCYTYAPHVFTPLYLIYPPLIGVPIVYQFILRVVGSVRVHKISYTRALAGRTLVLLPYLLVILFLAGRQFPDYWNAEVRTDFPGYRDLMDPSVKVEKHLHNNWAYVEARTTKGTVRDTIKEEYLEYPEQDFFGFIRSELKHFPIRVSEFSSRLNVRIFKKQEPGDQSQGTPEPR